MSWVITPTYDGLVSDADATAYLAAVQAADGQLLEPAVRIAVNNFIVGCKADGIWTAIKASCILAGARTLAGALVPLAGTAPTNVNFVSGDYNRKTGLAGDGSTKYLDSNRNNNADPQNSKHLAIYAQSLASSGSSRSHIGALQTGSTVGSSMIIIDGSVGVQDASRYRINGATALVVSNGLAAGFNGASRSLNSTIVARQSQSDTSGSSNSDTPQSSTTLVFARSTASAIELYSNARLAFYSIGESLNLALLDARVTTLINAFAAAIP
jgi:hypothetical protein